MEQTFLIQCASGNSMQELDSQGLFQPISDGVLVIIHGDELYSEQVYFITPCLAKV